MAAKSTKKRKQALTTFNREHQHTLVDSDLVGSRQQDLRQYGERCPRTPKGEKAPENAACQRQQQTFGQELPDNAAPARAERRA